MLLLIILILIAIVLFVIQYFGFENDFVLFCFVAFVYLSLMLGTIMVFNRTITTNYQTNTKQNDYYFLQNAVNQQIKENNVVDGKLLENVKQYNEDIRFKKEMYNSKLLKGIQSKKYLNSLKEVKVKYKKKKEK